MIKAKFERGVRRWAGAFAVLAMTSILTVGCSSAQPWEEPGPRETFETFLMDLWRGNQEAAFDAITPDVRERLMGPLDALSEILPPDDVPPPHEMLVAGRIDNPFDIQRIEVERSFDAAPKKGEAVTLNLQYHDDRKGQARMIWGGERWYVDLPAPRQRPIVDVASSAPTEEPAPEEPSQPQE